jgi:hypothetical protein
MMRGCSCIRSGGNGRIILNFSDGAIPWKCPDANKCRHLENMAGDHSDSGTPEKRTGGQMAVGEIPAPATKFRRR